MTKIDSKNFAANTSDPPAILLLGDDGRMAHLLRRRFKNFRLFCVDNPLQGIVRLNENTFDLVLLNAEATAGKTAQAVKSLRRIAPDTRVFTFGEPFAEPHGHDAIKAGAENFLVWPVPASQLKRLLEPKPKYPPHPPDTPNLHPSSPAQPIPPLNILDNAGSESVETSPAGTVDVLRQFRQLAQLIPKGAKVLIEQAQKLLPDVLQIEWVTIHPADLHNGSPLPSSPPPNDQPGPALTMHGPMGPAGQMLLGPSKHPQLNHLTLAQQAADYLATLLHLTTRDQSLKHLATIDELTGAYNRRYLEYFLRRMIEQSKYEHTDVTLLIFDIDNFKHYNDNYGHSAGDNILRQATKLMRRCCRSHDVVARMGGDEFAVLFWDTHRRRKVYKHEDDAAALSPELTILRPTAEHDPDQNNSPPQTHAELAVFMSNRFRRMMKKSEFPGLGPHEKGTLTISGGLAHFPLHKSSVADLLARADQALLTAKRTGKNRLYLVGRPAESTA